MKEVAVLLATHNGARHVEEQLRSLARNFTFFTLHWLDDQSEDETREVVWTVSASLGLRLCEWKCDQRLRVPGAFFWLLEQVQADFYLFCDQDDIWQPGKIDATIEAMMDRERAPLFCFSEPYVFKSENPAAVRRYFDVIGVSALRAQMPSRAFVLNPAVGNTVGISRSLRDLLLTHLGVARSNAIMHDWWLYLLALAQDRVQLMVDAPTSLYRQHATNFYGVGRKGRWRSIAGRWRDEQRFRVAISVQATGFLSVVTGFTQTEVLGVMVRSARRLAEVAHRRGPGELAVLARDGMLPLPCKRSIWFSAVSLLSDALNVKADEVRPDGWSGS